MDRKQKILIVDDIQANIESLKAILSELDIYVVEATSGNEAVLLTLQYDFDLILIDVQMPEMDGFEAVELIKMEEKNKLVPVIFQTAIYRDDDNIIKGIKSGAVDYITKPIKEEILLGKVRHFLEMQRNKKELEETRKELEEKVERLEQLEEELRETNKVLKNQAITDSLTGLFNRRFFIDSLSRKLYDSNRYFWPLSLFMFDVDNFKEINDNFGHVFGDKVLAKIGEILKTGMRKTDYAGRYGGDEFLILFTNASKDVAFNLAEKIRNAIKEVEFEEHPEVKVTISGGLLENVNDINPDSFINKVDKMLYKAKKNGRDRVEQKEQEKSLNTNM